MPSATVTFCELPKKLNVVPSNVKLSDPFNTLPVASATKTVFALALPNVVDPAPTTASIKSTLSVKVNVVLAPDCNL